MLFRGFKYFALGVCTLVENRTVATSSTGHTVGGLKFEYGISGRCHGCHVQTTA